MSARSIGATKEEATGEKGNSSFCFAQQRGAHVGHVKRLEVGDLVKPSRELLEMESLVYEHEHGLGILEEFSADGDVFVLWQKTNESYPYSPNEIELAYG